MAARYIYSKEVGPHIPMVHCYLITSTIPGSRNTNVLLLIVGIPVNIDIIYKLILCFYPRSLSYTSKLRSAELDASTSRRIVRPHIRLLGSWDSSNMTTLVKEKWWKIQWFSADDTPEERKFLLKLDLILVPYLLISYWVKNLDQSNLSE